MVARVGTDQYPIGRVEDDAGGDAVVVGSANDVTLLFVSKGAANLLSKSISARDIMSR
jgi:hypothetical protein